MEAFAYNLYMSRVCKKRIKLYSDVLPHTPDINWTKGVACKDD